MVDSIPYADKPSHEGYMPSFLRANERLTQFFDYYHGTSGLDLDAELDSLQNDLQAIFEGGIEATIVPGASNTFAYYDTEGLNTILQVPAGAVITDTTLVYEPLASVTPPPGLLFGGQAFNLEPFQGGMLVPGFTFSSPVTVTLLYDNADVTAIYEPGLGMYYWDGANWKSEGITILGRDALHDRLTVAINHLTEFALFGEQGFKVFLPFSVH
jgi:hypothetical protein